MCLTAEQIADVLSTNENVWEDIIDCIDGRPRHRKWGWEDYYRWGVKDIERECGMPLPDAEAIEEGYGYTYDLARAEIERRERAAEYDLLMA